MDLPTLKEKLTACLDKFCTEQAKLLINDAHEEAISTELIRYMYMYFGDMGLNINGQYDKRIIDKVVTKKKIIFLINQLPMAKRNSGETIAGGYLKKEVLPDIIFHQMENSDNNFLVVEIKKVTNTNKTDRDFDILKLKVFTESDLKYKFGLFIDFRNGVKYNSEEPYSLRYFIDGYELA